MKLVHVSNGPLPYHTPILNELNKLVDLHVIYMSRGHPLGSFHDLWGTAPAYSHDIYWSFPVRWHRADFRAQVSAGVSRQLRRLSPDTILVISWGPLVLEPLAWRRVAGSRAVMWAESTSFSGLFRGRLSNSVRRAIVAMTDAVVTESMSATKYLEKLGAANVITSCLPSPHVPPPGGFAFDEGDRSADPPAYLFVGRLIPRKRPLELIRDFQQLASKLPNASLTIVGDGPLQEEVTQAVKRAGQRVRLLPRLEGERLKAIYAAADVLVVPSVREGWGLVVNEGLAHGLYVVATDQVGSALDLLRPDTGRIVPAHDSGALISALLDAGKLVPRTRDARRHRARSVEHCTPAKFARDIQRAALAAWGER